MRERERGEREGGKRTVEENLPRGRCLMRRWGANLESFHLSHGLHLCLGLKRRSHEMRKVELQKVDAGPRPSQCQTELPGVRCIIGNSIR